MDKQNKNKMKNKKNEQINMSNMEVGDEIKNQNNTEMKNNKKATKNKR